MGHWSLPGGWLYSSYLLAFVVSTLVCLGAAWRAQKIPYAETRQSLTVFFLSSAGWAAAYVGFLLPFSRLGKTFFYQISLIVGFGTVWAWLWFCSAYTGRSLHRNAGVQRFAAVVFVAVLLLKVTNPFHELYYTLEPARLEAFGVVVRHGLLYWVVMGVSYALATTGYLMLFELFVKTETRTGPLAALTALTALPAALNILGHVNPWLQDITHEPLGVAVFAVGVLFLYTYQFQAVRLAGSLSAPTIMLSPEGRIRDYGRHAASLFPDLKSEAAVGQPLGAVLPRLAERLDENRPLLEHTDTSGQDAPRYYRIVETDFGGGDGQGRRVVVLSDITERERRKRALQSRKEKVEALYAAVSQLLRARDKEGVGDVALRLVNKVFGYSLVGVRLVEDETLVPIQHSPKVFEHMPTRPPVDVGGSSLIAEAYRSGEPRVVDDLSAVEGPLEYGAARAAAFFPMGEHGIISVGELQAGAIDAFDTGLMEVLAAHAGVVLARLDQEQALRAAKKEADEANEMKSALLANMSHEIRTPLTSIIGFAEEIATMTDGDAGPVARFAGHIENSGRRLLGTLDAVLNLSRLEGADMDATTRPVDLSDMAQTVAEQYAPDAAENEVRYHIHTTDQPLWVQGDREALRMTLRNLISNAVKYTGAGDGIWIRTREESQTAVLEVEDSGIGMNASKTDTLFEPFRQESEGIGREYEGTGLGLTVTKEAVEKMGGTIGVDTEKGRGSRFTVRLVRADAPISEEASQDLAATAG